MYLTYWQFRIIKYTVIDPSLHCDINIHKLIIIQHRILIDHQEYNLAYQIKLFLLIFHMICTNRKFFGHTKAYNCSNSFAPYYKIIHTVHEPYTILIQHNPVNTSNLTSCPIQIIFIIQYYQKNIEQFLRDIRSKSKP